jgi:hypothetical protein
MRELLRKTGSAGGLAAGWFRRTRPRPVRGADHQPRIHRIRLDIPDHRSKLLAGSDPAVEVLALPKGLPRSSSQAVGANGGGGLQPAHNPAELLMRFHYHVDVIGHDHPREKIVTALGILAVEECLDKGRGNIRILQPSRSAAHPVQVPIMYKESPSRIRIRGEERGRGLGEGTCQTPCDKDDRIVRDPMRKFSVPEHDFRRNRRQDRRRYRAAAPSRWCWCKVRFLNEIMQVAYERF